MYIEFGQLYFVEHFTELQDFFHVHTCWELNEKWNKGVKLTTIGFQKKIPTDIFKREREIFLEKYRSLHFSDYPTRCKCMFLIDFNQTQTWINNLKCRAPIFQLVRIKLINGKFINLDDCLYENKVDKFDDGKALSYWSGMEYCEENSLPVYLFEGDFIITELLKEEKRTIND